MHAASGDWLVVQSSRDGVSARYGEIVATSANGAPPYTVRWVDTDRTVLVFPGPDATIISAQRRAALKREQVERATRVQSEIAARRHT